ncbi:hypothetical protein RHECNPAF_13300183 [Rhizobium etli CNPAF512]|nr:hypothetical protein RHECNPAF_13300183 [Rhizobium etli CNPAF512]
MQRESIGEYSRRLLRRRADENDRGCCGGAAQENCGREVNCPPRLSPTAAVGRQGKLDLLRTVYHAGAFARWSDTVAINARRR